MKSCQIILSLFFIFVIALAVPAEVADTDKAKFIVDLVDQIKWPSVGENKSDKILKIAVIGSEKMVETLKLNSDSSKINVKSINIDDDLGNTDILVISTTELPDLAKILKKVKKKPVLTVTDSKGFARYGVMIEIITNGDEIEFVINKMSAKEVKIDISSKLIDKAKATFG